MHDINCTFYGMLTVGSIVVTCNYTRYASRDERMEFRLISLLRCRMSGLYQEIRERLSTCFTRILICYKFVIADKAITILIVVATNTNVKSTT